MTSIADQVAAPQIAGAAGAVASGPAGELAARASAISLPAVGERELRLDLFRGLALWLIFIDHLPPSLLTWFTLRNYGFSDAAETETPVPMGEPVRAGPMVATPVAVFTV